MYARFFVLFFLILNSVELNSQTISPYLERPDGFEKADIESVFSLRIGPDQNLYVGHQGGVSKYNGYNFEHLSFSGRSSASDNLNFNSEGILWGRTFAGDILFLYDGKLKRHSISDVNFNYLPTLWKSKNNLYLRFDNKLFLAKDTNLIFIYEDSTKRNNADFGIITINDSTDVFISNYASYFIKQNSLKVHFEFDHEKLGVDKNLKVPQTFRTIEWKGNNYLAGYREIALQKITPQKDSINFLKPNIQLDYSAKTKVHEIKNIDDRVLAVAGYSGFQIQDFKTDRNYRVLENQVIAKSISNSFGGIWIATIKDGLYHIPSLDILQFKLDDVNSDLYRSFRLNDTLIGLGRMNGELDLINANGNFLKKVVLPKKSEIQSVIQEGDYLYIFCDNFYQYNLKSNEFTIQLQSASTKDFWCNDSCFFIATSFGMFDLQNQNEEGKASKVIEGYWFSDIEERTENELLLASKEGLFRYFINKNELIPLPSHWSIEPSVRQVVLWRDRIVTNIEGKGVFYLDDQYSYLPVYEDPSAVKRILVNNGKLYVLLADKVIEYQADLSSRVVFDKKLLIPNLKIQDFQVTDQHLFLFQNRNYIRIPIDFKNPSKEFRVNILSLESSFKKDGKKLFSEYDENYFNIRFEISPSILGKEVTTVRYRIGDSEWKNIPHEKGVYEIFQNMLPWGASLLEIEITKGSNVEIIKYELFVNKPYWLQWWFLGLMILIFLIFIYFIYQWRVNMLKKKARRDLESQRMKNKLLNAELTAIRSQMQPHFIYNVLTSLQAKILKGEKKKAYDSANSFSKLMRNVLDNSQKEFIVLSEELDFLKSYIQLESDRFEDGVDFRLEIDPNIKTEEVLIPTLICQPFVENAFKHGLRHLDKDRKLSLKIYQKAQQIIIEIEDNGVGRIRSAEINSENKSYHQSFATKAMEERVNRINESSKELKVNYSVTDLEKGTKVIISLNYE